MDPEAEMREREWKKLVLQVDKLTLVQRSKLHGALERHGAEAQVVALIDRAGEAAPTCPHCRASRVVRNGQANGLQRYKRSACAHTFNALTGTPTARLRHKGKWLARAQVLSQGLSIHAAANTLDVALSTAFRWRHRFLALARDAKAGRLTGVATSYLASYLGWFRALDRSESTSTEPACLLALALGHGTRP
jgi:transposase-like protein